jgi:predicted dehydrogenase
MKPIGVGIIGCGGFARGMHVPNLMKNPKYKIIATMDIVEESAKNLAETTGAMYHTTDANVIFADPQVDVVFITTTHETHADLSIRAAQAGKHVMCEKPMALNAAECKAIALAVKKAGVKYTVGYNRGMAPFVQKAKRLLATVPHKKMIYHRIQADFPATHWTHDPNVGGGRFVGEGCHVFDLFCELVDAPPVMVYAAGGTFLDPDLVKIPDSANVTITFADGSVATTLIASAGCPAFPKESTEIYCDKKAISITDFREMEYYGFENQDKVKLEFSAQDKGQICEIDLLADAILNNTEAPNGLVKAARSALISYKVMESLATGRPVPMTESEYMF